MQQGKSAGSCGCKCLFLKSYKIWARMCYWNCKKDPIIKNVVETEHNCKSGSNKGTEHWLRGLQAALWSPPDLCHQIHPSVPLEDSGPLSHLSLSHIHAPHLMSALEVTFPAFPLCHTEQSLICQQCK